MPLFGGYMDNHDEELPREKAIKYGVEKLSNAELLALILRTGSQEKSVLDLAEHLLNEIGGIEHLKDMNYHTLIQIKGIKKAKSIALLATLELGRRAANSEYAPFTYGNPEHVYDYLKNQMMHLKQEHFVILILDNRLRLIREKTLFIGSINRTLVSIREVFSEALSVNGVYVICVHNHPSGDPSPSQDDIDMTYRLMEAGDLMGIEVLDHIIIGWNCYYSFKARQMKSVTENLQTSS